MTYCTPKCKKYTLIGISVSVVVLGILLATLWNVIYTALVNNELRLTNSSTSYKMWKETPIPIFFEIYMFNWTNSDKVLKDWTVKPVMEELGPYTFSEHHIRVNLQWHENGTVSYQQKRIWRFIPEKSNGSLSDKVININPVAATVGYFVRDKSMLVQKTVDLFLEEKEKSLAIEKTVDELLYKGYKDDLLSIISKFNITGLDIPFDKFGWFYNRNGSETYDGNFTMYTGEDDILKLGDIENWNGAPITSYYKGECAFVNGTSGELWPPLIDSPSLQMFVPDTCSYITIDFKNVTEVLGLEGRVYAGGANVFDNGTKYPESACFNVGQIDRSGIRNVSRCKFGAPAFVSYPHFYLADPMYRDAIEGMNPDKDKHEMTITLEPRTGIPLNVRAQLQLNLMVDRLEHVGMFKKVKRTFMPMLWFRQSATLTQDLADQAKLLLTLPAVFQYTGYGILGLGCLFISILVFIHFRKEWKDTDTENLIDEQ